MNSVFRPDAYDRHFCLKPSVGMVLAMVFAVRHLLLVFLAYFPGMAGGADTHFIRGILSPSLIAADLLVLPLLAAWYFRQPGAGRVWRVIWRNGKVTLVVALCLQLALLADTRMGRLFGESPQADDGILLIGYGLLQLYVLAYASMSRRLAAVFRDFPAGDGDSGRQPASARPEAGDEGSAVRNPQAPGAEALPPVGAEKNLDPLAGLADGDAGSVIKQLREVTAALRPGQPEEAERLALLLTRDTPEAARVWQQLAMLAVRGEKLEAAATLLVRAATVDGKNGLYPRNLCEVLRRLGRLDAALAAGRQAVTLLPEDAGAHYNLGLVLADSGQPEAAIESYRTAVRLRPGYAEAWNNLGVTLRKVGDDEAAHRAFEEAVAAAPGMQEAEKNLRGMALET